MRLLSMSQRYVWHNNAALTGPIVNQQNHSLKNDRLAEFGVRRHVSFVYGPLPLASVLPLPTPRRIQPLSQC